MGNAVFRNVGFAGQPGGPPPGHLLFEAGGGKPNLAGALAMLLNNTWRPGSSRSMERLLDMIEQVMAEIPLYEMACTREPQAARMACAVMKGT